MRAELAARDPTADLNRTELDGRTLTVGALQAAADAMPFLGEWRLVIVRGLLAATTGRKDAAEALVAYLQHVPPTTRLVLVEADVPATHRVVKWAHQWCTGEDRGGAAGSVRRFEAPPPAQLPRWLARRAEDRGGRIEPPAAAALADALVRDGAVDLRVADGELEKLLTYAGERPVGTDDVARLVTPVTLDSVFRLVDALADGDGGKAANLLHRHLAEGEQPLRLLALVVRQYRQLAHARALLDAGSPPGDLARAVGVPPFAAARLAGQARRYSSAALGGILRRLLAIDTGIKTGRVDARLALDLFVAEVCPARRR